VLDLEIRRHRTQSHSQSTSQSDDLATNLTRHRFHTRLTSLAIGLTHDRPRTNRRRKRINRLPQVRMSALNYINPHHIIPRSITLERITPNRLHLTHLPHLPRMASPDPQLHSLLVLRQHGYRDHLDPPPQPTIPVQRVEGDRDRCFLVQHFVVYGVLRGHCVSPQSLALRVYRLLA